LKQNRTLKNLTLAENDLKSYGAEFIFKSATNLESLDLGKNYIKPNIGPALKEYLEKNQNLKKLNLEYNELLATGVEHLANGLASSQRLMSLNLKGNGIRDEGLEILSRALYDNKTLEELDVSLNEITPVGIQYLAESLISCNIKTLNLSKNLLGDESLIIIADCATGTEGLVLQKLDISSSRISDNGILHFLERLDYFEKLRVIKASDNFISEKIEKILIEILEKN
jgi:Ran GTPase-activating protein (RanGAP) involved in mRNA processing and transport